MVSCGRRTLPTCAPSSPSCSFRAEDDSTHLPKRKWRYSCPLCYDSSMQIGTLGEWVGAVATAVATAVALYFGTRDQALGKDRSDARLAIRRKAADDSTPLRRLLADIDRAAERNDVGHMADDATVAHYVKLADRLGPVRRFRVRRNLRWLYSQHMIDVADIDPNLGEEGALIRRFIVSQFIANGENLNYRTDTRYHAALVEPADPKKVKRVLRRFARLARI